MELLITSENYISIRTAPVQPWDATTVEDSFLTFSAQRKGTTTAPQIVSDPFIALRTRISATTVRRRLYNSGLHAKRPVFVCSTETTTEKVLGYEVNAICFCTIHR